MSWFKRERKTDNKPAERWQMVQIVIASNVKFIDGSDETIYFYLYESNKCNRDVEVKCRGRNLSKEQFGILDYGKKVYPWLKGQDFPDIKTYWDVVKEKRKEDIKQMYKVYFEAKE